MVPFYPVENDCLLFYNCCYFPECDNSDCRMTKKTKTLIGFLSCLWPPLALTNSL